MEVLFPNFRYVIKYLYQNIIIIIALLDKQYGKYYYMLQLVAS